MAKGPLVFEHYEKLSIDEKLLPWEQARPSIVETAMKLGTGYEAYLAACLGQLARDLRQLAGSLPLEVVPQIPGHNDEYTEETAWKDEPTSLQEALNAGNLGLVRLYLGTAASVVRRITLALGPGSKSRGFRLEFAEPRKRGRPAGNTASPEARKKTIEKKLSAKLAGLVDVLSLISDTNEDGKSRNQRSDAACRATGIARERIGELNNILKAEIVSDEVIASMRVYMLDSAKILKLVVRLLFCATDMQQAHLSFRWRGRGKRNIVATESQRKLIEDLRLGTKQWKNQNGAILNFQVLKEKNMLQGRGYSRSNLFRTKRFFIDSV